MEVVNSCQVMSSSQQHRLSNEQSQLHHSQQQPINSSGRNTNSSQPNRQPEKMDISNGNILLTNNDYDRNYVRRQESVSNKDVRERQKNLESTGSDMLVDVKPFGMHHSDSISSKDSLSSNQFFNETLDLSQEDIQQTLSANMPMTCGTPESQHR